MVSGSQTYPRTDILSILWRNGCECSKSMTNEVVIIEFEFWLLYTMICKFLNVTSLIAQRCRCLFYVFW